MTKRYDEPIDVTAESHDDGGPLSFAWRGTRYDVDQRLSSWREGGEWWNGAQARDNEFHRILARPSGMLSTGEVDAEGFLVQVGAVFDVYRDRVRGGWRLARLWD